MSSPTGSPMSASSSSRTRVTPARALRKRLAPHAAHTGGRVAPHRGHTSSSSGWCTAASHDRAARQLAAGAARQELRPAGSVEDAQRASAVAEPPGQRSGEEPVARILLPLVHHLDHRPARPVAGAVGGVELAPAERLQRGARAGEHAGHPGSPRPLDGDVPRVPGG